MSTSRDVSGWVGKRAPIARVVRVVITEPEMEAAAAKPVEAEASISSTPVKAEKVAGGGKYVPVHLRSGYKPSAASALPPRAPVKPSLSSRYDDDDYDESDSAEARWYYAQGNRTTYEAGTNVMPYSDYWSEWAVAQREYEDRIRRATCSSDGSIHIAGPATGAGAGARWETIGGYRKTAELPPDEESVRKSKKSVAAHVKHDEADDADE